MVLPSQILERLVFLRRKLEMRDEDAVIERGLRLLDLITCAVMLEGGKLLVKNRDGTVEVLNT